MFLAIKIKFLSKSLLVFCQQSYHRVDLSAWVKFSSYPLLREHVQCDVILGENLGEKRVCSQKGAYRTVICFPVCTLSR